MPPERLIPAMPRTKEPALYDWHGQDERPDCLLSDKSSFVSFSPLSGFIISLLPHCSQVNSIPHGVVLDRTFPPHLHCLMDTPYEPYNPYSLVNALSKAQPIRSQNYETLCALSLTLRSHVIATALPQTISPPRSKDSPTLPALACSCNGIV